MKIKNILPKSLFGRSFLIIACPLILVQLVSTYVFMERHLTAVTRNLAQNIANIVSVAPYMDVSVLQKNFSMYAEYDPHMRMPVHQFSTTDLWEDQFLHEALEEKLQGKYWLNSSPNILKIYIPYEKGVLKFFVPRKKLMSRTTPLVFICEGIAVIFFLTIAAIFLKNQVRPLKRLAENAENFGKGRETSHFKLSGAQEIRQAGVAFNAMKDRIKRQMDQRMEMLAGISHDLRTPLTRMKLSLEMAPKNTYTDSLKSDVNEMQSMVHEFLDFVRGDATDRQTVFNLTAMIQDICLQYQFHKNFNITATVDKDIQYGGRPSAIRRALQNVITNGEKFASKVDITVKKTSHTLIIIIDDNGPGIPKDKYEDVFKPFYRLDESRNSQLGGVGLGLSITQDIIHSHGGRISLDKSVLGGLRVIIRLPV